MPTWPTSLPCYPVDGTFTETPQRNVARFQPEIGPSMTRRRSTANGSLASLTWKMNKAELAIFMTFYETELKDGSLSFSMKHPITDYSHSWSFESEPEISSIGRNVHTVAVQLRRITDTPLADISIESLEVI